VSCLRNLGNRFCIANRLVFEEVCDDVLSLFAPPRADWPFCSCYESTDPVIEINIYRSVEALAILNALTMGSLETPSMRESKSTRSSEFVT
jgi:hypothetical protein